MPVAETISILNFTLILVMILVVPLMEEQVSTVNECFTLYGFTGVLVVARLGGGLSILGVIFVLIAALLAATFHLMT